jgi:hypothetical protein
MDDEDVTLYYGIGLHEGLVFVPKPQAQELVALIRALETAQTWGEFRAAVTEGRYREALAQLGLEEDPADDASFDAERFEGYQDGDWPEWPAQEMLEWLPDEVQMQFGRAEETPLNGDYLHIAVEDREAVLELLEDYGFRCQRNQPVIDLLEKHILEGDEDEAEDEDG